MGSARSWRWYWLGFAFAVFLLLWLDLLTTVVAAGMYGLQAEANPIMRWLLGRGLGWTILAHLAIAVLVVIGFRAVLRIGHALDPPHRDTYRRLCRAWLSVLIIGGALIITNNLLVIAAGL